MSNLSYPECDSRRSTQRSYHCGKQNHQCEGCGRQFVADSQHVDEETKDVIKRLLLERLSLSGICRVVGVSHRPLLSFIVELYDQSPDDLNVQLSGKRGHVRLLRLQAKADEVSSLSR